MDQRTAVKLIILWLFLCVGIALYVANLRETVTVYKTRAETFEAACDKLIDRHVVEDRSNYPSVGE